MRAFDETRTLERHSSYVRSVCVTGNGAHVVTGSGDNTARVWRLDDGAHVRTLEGHSGPVYSVCVTHDGAHVVTGSDDRTVRTWLLADGTDPFLLIVKSLVPCSRGTSPVEVAQIKGSRSNKQQSNMCTIS